MTDLTYKDLEKGLLFSYLGGTGLVLLYSASLMIFQGYINIRTQNVMRTIAEFGLIGLLGLILAWRTRK